MVNFLASHLILKRFLSFYCDVNKGTLLKDGRFAFLMVKEQFDLHTLIKCNIKQKIGKKCGPFSKEEVNLLMYYVA